MNKDIPLSERTHTDEDGIRVATWENVAEAVEMLKGYAEAEDNLQLINTLDEIFGDLK